MLFGLIYYTFLTIHWFLTSKIPHLDRCKLLKKLTAIEEFYKFSYLTYNTKDDDIFNNLDNSLLLFGCSLASPAEQSKLDSCILPMEVLEDVRDSFCRDPGDLEVVDSGVRRLQLYACQLHRIVTQEARIGQYLLILKQLPAENSTNVMMDYKMKLKRIRYFDSSVQFYRKRGISWHGTVVLFNNDRDGMAVLKIWERSCWITS